MEDVKVVKALENNIVLYFHKNATTGEIFYVGIGKPKRPYDFNSRNTHWVDYVKINGEPVILIIASNLTWKSAAEWEKLFIRLYGRKYAKEKGTLVNLTRGGEGCYDVVLTERGRQNIIATRKLRIGAKHSEETKKKMSVSNSGKIRSLECRRQMSERWKGKKWSDEQKAKLKGRPSHNKGKKLSVEYRLHISEGRKGVAAPNRIQVINTLTGDIYDSILAAAKATGWCDRYLTAVLNGRIQTNKTGLQRLKPK